MSDRAGSGSGATSPGVTAAGLHYYDEDEDDNDDGRERAKAMAKAEAAAEASGQGEAEASPARDDERSHTFRQRRLTYTRHHLQGAAAAAAALVADDLDVSDDDQEQEEGGGQRHNDEKASAAATAVSGTEQDNAYVVSTAAASSAEDKVGEASTDSKADEKEAADSGVDDANDSSSEAEAIGSPPTKIRRLEARVLHATAPPHHMRREARHRLYEHQNSECAAHRQAETEHAVHVEELEMAEKDGIIVAVAGTEGDGVSGDGDGDGDSDALISTTATATASSTASAKKRELPEWRKRRFIRHSIKEDESLLPFPRHIVGTYSCHGVEPLYDSDYDHDEDDADDSNGNGNGNGQQSTADAEDSDDDVKGAARTAGDNTVAKINQDRGGVAFPYGNCPRTALFAAYDGHGDGGEYVAQYALHEVQRRLERHPNFDTDIAKAFHDTFVGVDEDLRTVPEIEALYAGATACVVLLREKTLTIANAGDSRAVLARRRRGSGKDQRLAMDLSVDQNPDSPGEQERIEKAGGFVSPPPEPGLSARVWLDAEYTQIGLAMARSIGDHAVKPVGVIADPAVTSHDLTDEDEFMIVATDGVWEFVSSDEAIEIVARHLDAGEGASRACQCLIEEAAAKWHDFEGDYRDDITALVVTFEKIWDSSPLKP